MDYLGVFIGLLFTVWLIGRAMAVRSGTAVPATSELSAAEIRALTWVATHSYRHADESDRQWRIKLPLRLRANVTHFDLDCTSVSYHQSSGVDAWSILTRDRQYMFVGIRGTQGLFDLITDFRFLPRRTSNGWGHTGFYETAEDIWHKLGLKQRLKQFPDSRVLVGAHSLGAGAASALMLIAEQDNTLRRFRGIDGAVLLCSPRFASWRLARFMNRVFRDRTVRVSYCRDLVALVPFRFMGFAHFSADNYYDRNGELHLSVTGLYRITDFFVSAIKDAGQLRLMRNMIGYHNSLEVGGMVRTDSERF